MDLVLLPDGLITVEQGLECFNPYFNGSSTSTDYVFLSYYHGKYVSILILMDLVLLPPTRLSSILIILCFNPYFNGSSTSTLLYPSIKSQSNMFQSLF